jgi:hypothetical protein
VGGGTLVMRWLNTMGEYGLTWPHSVEENKDTCVEATTGSGDPVRHTTPTMPQIGTNISPKHSHTRTHLQIGHMSRTAQFTCPLLFDCGGMTIWERSTELHPPTINIERERPKRGEREREESRKVAYLHHVDFFDHTLLLVRFPPH